MCLCLFTCIDVCICSYGGIRCVYVCEYMCEFAWWGMRIGCGLLACVLVYDGGLAGVGRPGGGGGGGG